MIVLVGALSPALAQADVSPEDAAKATAMFEQGRKLIEGGKLGPACDAFEGSLRLDPQIGTRLNLADCREQQGRLVEAYALFDQAEQEASLTSKEGRAAFAHQRLTALAAKLVRVTVHVVEPDRPGLVVKLGARVIDRAGWAKPQVLVPGPVVVDASAPGATPFHDQRTATAGTEVTIDVPALELLPVAPAPPIATPKTGRSWKRTSYIVGGAGGALLLGSVVVGLHAKSRYNTAVDRDDAHGVSSAQHEADVATGIAVVGAAAVTVGVVLYLRARSHGVVVAPTSDGNSVGLLVARSF